MDHKSILALIGDYKEIAAKLGLHPSAVSRWKSKGIPPGRWVTISRMARQMHIRGVTLEAIEQGARPRRRAKEQGNTASVA